MKVQLRRIGASAGWLLLARAFGAALSLVYLAIATRTLGLVDFGRFALILAIGQGISAVVGFQTWQFVVRYGLQAQEKGNEEGVARIIGAAAALDFTAALIGSLLALAAIFAFGPLLGLPHDLYGAAFGFCLAILLAVRSTPIGILRLDQRFRDAALADSALPSVRAAGAVLAALLLPSVTGFLYAWAAAELTTAAIYWWVALRKRRLVLSPDGMRKIMREEPTLWNFLLLTNLSSTLTLTAKQFTLIVVGAFGGPAAAGTFRVAAQLAQALVKITQTFSRAAYAELVTALSTSRDRALLLRLTMIAGFVSILLVGFAALFGQPLLHLVASHQFSGAYLPILVLVAAAGFDLLGFAFEPALTARGQTGVAFRLRLIATAVQATLLFTLLPLLGMIGGAWATLMGSVVATMLTGWAALKRRPEIKIADRKGAVPEAYTQP